MTIYEKGIGTGSRITMDRTGKGVPDLKDRIKVLMTAKKIMTHVSARAGDLNEWVGCGEMTGPTS